MCRNQDRHDGMRTALRVEVEQIERVVLGLLTIEHAHRRCADLEFQYQDRALGQQNSVDPSSQTEQRIFEQHTPVSGISRRTVRSRTICCRQA